MPQQDQVKQQQHQNEELQKQLQLQQKHQLQQPQKVDSKQKPSKSATKGAPAPTAAPVPHVDLQQQQQIEEMTLQLRSYEAEIEDLKGQLQVRAHAGIAVQPVVPSSQHGCKIGCFRLLSRLQEELPT
jgi:hypothetical protein